jgi:hypothetical protein
MKNYKVYNLMLGGASIAGSSGSLTQNRVSSGSNASTVEFNPVPQIPHNIFPPRGGIVKNGAPAGDREIRDNNNKDISLMSQLHQPGNYPTTSSPPKEGCGPLYGHSLRGTVRGFTAPQFLWTYNYKKEGFINEPRMRNPNLPWKNREDGRCEHFSKYLWCPNGENCTKWHVSSLSYAELIKNRRTGQYLFNRNGTPKVNWMTKKRAPSKFDRIPVCEPFRIQGNCKNGICCSKLHIWASTIKNSIKSISYYETAGFNQILNNAHKINGRTFTCIPCSPQFQGGVIGNKVQKLKVFYDELIDNYKEGQTRKLRNINFYHTLDPENEQLLKHKLAMYFDKYNLDVSPENIKEALKNKKIECTPEEKDLEEILSDKNWIIDVSWSEEYLNYIKPRIQQPPPQQPLALGTIGSKVRIVDSNPNSLSELRTSRRQVTSNISYLSAASFKDNKSYLDAAVFKNRKTSGGIVQFKELQQSSQPQLNRFGQPIGRLPTRQQTHSLKQNTRFDSLSSKNQQQSQNQQQPKKQNTRFDALSSKNQQQSQNQQQPILKRNTRFDSLQQQGGPRLPQNDFDNINLYIGRLVYNQLSRKQNIVEIFKELEEDGVFKNLINKSEDCSKMSLLKNFRANILKNLWNVTLGKHPINSDQFLYNKLNTNANLVKYAKDYILAKNLPIQRVWSYSYSTNRNKKMINKTWVNIKGRYKLNMTKKQGQQQRQQNTSEKAQRELMARNQRLQSLQSKQLGGSYNMVVFEAEFNNFIAGFDLRTTYLQIFFELELVRYFLNYLESGKAKKLISECESRKNKKLKELKKLEGNNWLNRDQLAIAKRNVKFSSTDNSAWGEGKIKIRVHNLLQFGGTLPKHLVDSPKSTTKQPNLPDATKALPALSVINTISDIVQTSVQTATKQAQEPVNYARLGGTEITPELSPEDQWVREPSPTRSALMGHGMIGANQVDYLKITGAGQEPVILARIWPVEQYWTYPQEQHLPISSNLAYHTHLTATGPVTGTRIDDFSINF